MSEDRILAAAMTNAFAQEIAGGSSSQWDPGSGLAVS
jgi:hypothetical protein